MAERVGDAAQDRRDIAEYEALLDDIWVAERKIIDLCRRSGLIAKAEARRDHTAEIMEFENALEEKQRG